MSTEELLKGLMSDDSDEILETAYKINRMVSSNNEQLVELAQHLPQIEENIKGKDFGGVIMSNDRFVYRAIDMIKAAKEGGKCRCEKVFEPFAQNAEYLASSYGFILVKKSESVSQYVMRGEIECPNCGARYEVEEEYTGWHMTSSRHKRIN